MADDADSIPAHERAVAQAVGVSGPSDLAQGVGVTIPGGATGAGKSHGSNAVTPAFDSYHPPRMDLVDDCVHCGFCLPTCPTYVLWGEEMDSPRGRIYLMKQGLQGEPLNDIMTRHFDQCLGCLACVTACPSGVQYEALLESTRQQVERRYQRPLAERLYRRLLYSLFPYPKRLSLIVRPLELYQRSGLQRVLRRFGVLDLFPERVRALDDLTPPMSRQDRALPEWTPAVGRERRRVGVLLGCVQRTFFSKANAATIRVLAADGCGVVAPSGQGCCGALSQHVGREDEAMRFARRTIDAFDAANVDSIVVNVAGCGSLMKEYGHLLRDDPAYAERAQRFSRKVRDVSEILDDMGPLAKRHPLPLTVVYHDACHLQHGQRVTAQPRKTLRVIPGLQIKEVPREREICCGSAGTYNLLQPGPARDLGDRKARNIIDAGGDILVTANPGCHLQIQAALRRTGKGMPAVHLVEVIDASIRGQPVQTLLGE
ncbi:MAG: heterodisulfide reductase-related iron-sulfur binding cluster [Chloroflexota bacterium]